MKKPINKAVIAIALVSAFSNSIYCMEHDNPFALFEEPRKGWFDCFKSRPRTDIEMQQIVAGDEGKRCLSVDTIKSLGINAAEITTKLAIALGAYRYYGPTELAFFAQHMASKAIGSKIKFKNNKLAPIKYVGGCALLYGTALGIKYFDAYAIDFDTGLNVVLGLSAYSLINNYFKGLRHEQNQHRLEQ